LLFSQISIAKSCLAAKEKPTQDSHGDQTDYNKCHQLFKEFDEICSIAQWLEEHRNLGTDAS
jgi:hypothetical protein